MKKMSKELHPNDQSWKIQKAAFVQASGCSGFLFIFPISLLLLCTTKYVLYGIKGILERKNRFGFGYSY
jgi:hypothetical protein